MKAITFKAPQSRNLTLEQTSFKSAFKSQARRQWLRLNLALRAWSRRACAKHGNLLVWISCVAASCGFASAIAELEAAAAVSALVAMAAMAPEMSKSTYDAVEEKGGEA